ncbi:hypothetical protein FRB90_012841 [Tulasnella sp. 427]|nr:hypothetical protein FRB90_012841 [Tulasnella sp. 427]
MLLYTDIISGDELFSDAYPMKVIDDVIVEVNCRMIVLKDGDVDIGANPSAEEVQEAVEDGAYTVNDVVYSFRLNQTSFDKKSYLTHLKGYMKALKAKIAEKYPDNPDKVTEFETKAAEQSKKIIGNLKNYDFYTGESMNVDGMVALLNFREDGTTPYFTFWRDGVQERKL